MTNVLPPLHAKINILGQVLEFGYHQNARHAFPNRIPFRHKHKNKKQKKAYRKAKWRFNRRANKNPLRLPIGQVDRNGVQFLFNRVFKCNDSRRIN